LPPGAIIKLKIHKNAFWPGLDPDITYATHHTPI